ncbi:hypothetical protein GQ42DRAFT_157716 [Ramicandelaber brevisporus]|nr:hypothetical protein GQ42DRAFT_157716 [Ramicandelaber brevisporus]
MTITYKSPDEVMMEVGFADVLDRATDALRGWICKQILAPLVSELEEIDSELQTAGLERLKVGSCTTLTRINPPIQITAQPPPQQQQQQQQQPKPAFGGGFFGGGFFGGGGIGQSSFAQPQPQQHSISSLADYVQAQGTTLLAARRMLVERYLSVPKFSEDARPYIIQRIHELASTEHMAGFSWKSGSVATPSYGFNPRSNNVELGFANRCNAHLPLGVHVL